MSKLAKTEAMVRLGDLEPGEWFVFADAATRLTDPETKFEDERLDRGFGRMFHIWVKLEVISDPALLTHAPYAEPSAEDLTKCGYVALKDFAKFVAAWPQHKCDSTTSPDDLVIRVDKPCVMLTHL